MLRKILENVKVTIESEENGVDTAIMIGSIVLRFLREPDYLKFLAEAEKEAIDPDQFLDMNDEDECESDQGVCVCERLQNFLMQLQMNLREMQCQTR